MVKAIPNRPSGHAHWRVYETAVEMGHQLYDTMMHDNEWYAYWKARWPDLTARELEVRFVAVNVKRLLPQARAMLAQIIATTPDPALKESCYEALCLDATLVRGRPH